MRPLVSIIIATLLICPAFADVKNPVAFIGQAVLGSTAGAPLSVDTNSQLVSGITNASVNATTTTTTTSTASPSTAVIASMTETPVAGTYYVNFCSSFQSNANNINVLFSIFAGGTKINGTEMSTTPQIQGGLTPSLNQRLPGCTTGFATVNGAQAIEIRWHVSAAGTATAGERIMTIMRIQ